MNKQQKLKYFILFGFSYLLSMPINSFASFYVDDNKVNSENYSFNQIDLLNNYSGIEANKSPFSSLNKEDVFHINYKKYLDEADLKSLEKRKKEEQNRILNNKNKKNIIIEKNPKPELVILKEEKRTQISSENNKQINTEIVINQNTIINNDKNVSTIKNTYSNNQDLIQRKTMESHIENKSITSFSNSTEEKNLNSNVKVLLKPIEADFSAYGIKTEDKTKLYDLEEYQKKFDKENKKIIEKRKEDFLDRERDYRSTIDKFFE